MTETPAFIDPIAPFGDEVGDGQVPGWLKLVVVLVVTAAGFYGFSYRAGPSLDSNHTFLEGSGGSAPAAGTSGSAGH